MSKDCKFYFIGIIIVLYFNKHKIERTKSKRENCSLSFRLCSFCFAFIDHDNHNHRDVSKLNFHLKFTTISVKFVIIG